MRNDLDTDVLMDPMDIELENPDADDETQDTQMPITIDERFDIELEQGANIGICSLKQLSMSDVIAVNDEGRLEFINQLGKMAAD
jgi:hypothetical protein